LNYCFLNWLWPMKLPARPNEIRSGTKCIPDEAF
jgi:hypothetical protein